MRFRHLKMNNHEMENIILIYNDTILCNQRILYKSFALDEEDGVVGADGKLTLSGVGGRRGGRLFSFCLLCTWCRHESRKKISSRYGKKSAESRTHFSLK